MRNSTNCIILNQGWAEFVCSYRMPNVFQMKLPEPDIRHLPDGQISLPSLRSNMVYKSTFYSKPEKLFNNIRKSIRNIFRLKSGILSAGSRHSVVLGCWISGLPCRIIRHAMDIPPNVKSGRIYPALSNIRPNPNLRMTNPEMV